MQFDIDKIIKILNKANAGNVEYKLTYCKDGKMYSIKMKIEELDGENEQ